MTILDFFGNPTGIFSLLALIPLILLYLIRPKAKNLTIPSLMFIMKKGGRQEKSSFLRNLLRDILFLIQIIIILLLAISVADPLIKIAGESSSENVVIVLDVSASMGAEGVWNEAASEAKNHLGSKNNIVLVGEHSLIALEDGTQSDARAVIDIAKPGISSSNIADGLSTARSLIEEGDIIVISDMRQTSSGDLLAAKIAAESEGLTVKMIDVSKDLGNLAIIDLIVNPLTTKIYVKNYYDEIKNVQLMVHDTEHSMTIAPDNMEILTIETPEGITKIEILDKDSLALDNIAYIATPEKQRMKILFITQDEQSSFLQKAISSSPVVDLEITHPPIVPDREYDFIVFQNVDISKLLSGTMDLIEEKVKSGVNVIFAYQDESYGLVENEIIPVEFSSKSNIESPIVVSILNSVTNGKEFGSISTYYNATAKPGSIVFAQTQQENPILVYREVGAGKVFYYGIPEINDFKYSPSFPIFWNDLLEFMKKSEDYSNYNYKGGKLIPFGKEISVRKPSGTIKTSALLLDELGLYEIEGRKAVASLIDRKESDLRYPKLAGISSESKESGSKDDTTTKVPYFISWVFIVILILLVTYELYFVKKRGDF